MSIEAMTLVLHHSQASGAAQMILMGIANHQGDGGAYPSIATLAKYGKVSERRVQQIIRDLEKSGELMISNNSGKTTATGATNLYRVILSCPENCDGSMNHRIRQGVKSEDARGEISMLKGVKPTSPKPVIEPLKKPIVQNEFERKVYDPDFELFWKAFPRKSGKLQAEKSFFKALKQVSLDELISAAEKYRDDPNRSPTFTKEASRWLNGGHWMDEPLPERKKTKEEIATEIADRNARQRELSKLASEERRREEEEARKRMAPPPTCQHGISIIKCRTCLLGLN